MSLGDRAKNDVTLMRIPKIQSPQLAQYFNCVVTHKLGRIIDVSGRKKIVMEQIAIFFSA